MNKSNMLKPTSFLTKQMLAALCATPLLFNATISQADEAPKEEMAAPAAEAAPAAAEAAKEPASPHSLTFNLGLYSEYMFRGVALSDGPALQGGIDYGHSSGFYAGTWWSNIDKNFTGHDDARDPTLDSSGGNKLETDWYVGFAHTFDSGFGINLLGNYYYYPDREDSIAATGGKGGNKQDSFEASIGVSYEFLTFTHYQVLTNYYGASADFTRNGKKNTKNATYDELKFNFKIPVADMNLLAKLGYQHTPNLLGSQADVMIGLNRDFSLPGLGKPIEGFNAGAYYTDTFNVKDEAYYNTTDGRDTNQKTIWFFVKRTW
jgi:uncharacterized protein (TIGR02001 family)